MALTVREDDSKHPKSPKSNGMEMEEQSRKAELKLSVLCLYIFLPIYSRIFKFVKVTGNICLCSVLSLVTISFHALRDMTLQYKRRCYIIYRLFVSSHLFLKLSKILTTLLYMMLEAYPNLWPGYLTA